MSIHNDAVKDAERKAHMKQSFEQWLDNPMVRMTMSTIPTGASPDALRMLLQAAFEAGFQTGGVIAVLDLLMEVSKKGAQ